MKRLISIMLMALLFISILAGCGQTNNLKPSDTGSNNKISVVATTFAPYDFVREIVGDKADISMLLPPASESHSYEPTPQDIIKIQNCDVFIYVGGESDEWVNEVLGSMDTSKMKIVTLMDCVTVVEEEIIPGMEDEEEEEAEEAGDEEAPEYDEHVWTSPKNAKLIVQKLSDTLRGVDAANASVYEQNTAAYLTKLDELDAAFQAVVDGAVRKTIVFGDRFPFRYFVDAYRFLSDCNNNTRMSQKSHGRLSFLFPLYLPPAPRSARFRPAFRYGVFHPLTAYHPTYRYSILKYE